MTQKDAGHDFDPKHRMIGAIVVVALAVVLIPLVLRDRAPAPVPVSATEQALPAEPVGEEIKVVVTKLSPPSAVAAPAPSATVGTRSAEMPAPAKLEPANGSAPEKPATSKTAPPAPTAASARRSETKRASSGWVVQVGTFSNANNATRLEQKLRAGGQPVIAERVSLEGAKAVRVRVGPFSDRTTALKAQERIQRDVGVRGVVLASP